jgi:hypothetical protein
MRFSDLVFSITLAAAVSAGVVDRRAAFTLQNGKDAQALNRQFASLTPSSTCTNGQEACVQNKLAQCVNGKFALSSCAGGLQCVVLPLVNKPGTRYDRHVTGTLFPFTADFAITAPPATPSKMLRPVSQPPAHKAAYSASAISKSARWNHGEHP